MSTVAWGACEDIGVCDVVGVFVLKLEPSMDCLGPAGACVALSAAL